MINIQKVKKSFRRGTETIEVLKNIQLQVTKGETLALVGKSGSGKSTLLSLMAGLERPDAGEIFLNGQNITQMTDKNLIGFRAKELGIVFQQFHLVSTLTALENVMLPLEILKQKNALERAQELLERVGLLHRRDHLPSELSGGECQRVAIARALSTGPSLLLADEPSGNLDEETGEKVMSLLFKMTELTQTTLVLVTHDPELAQRCRRVVHLEHGSLS